MAKALAICCYAAGGAWFPPLVVTLSNHELIIRLPFDRLRVSGAV